ncbi:MAG: tail fiber domain-containing protein [bacterium]|nr:tail fiber domain-containing protein [bacterium]
MNSRSRYGVQLLCSAIAICAIALPATAQESPARLAAADVGYVMSVSGVDGFYIEQAYSPGSTPSLSQLLSDAGFLADGAYTYEIRVVPALDDDSRAVLRLARETGDLSGVERLQSEGIIPEQAVASSGGFTIAQGQMVSGDVKEVSVASGDGVSTEGIDVHIMDQVILDDLIVDGSICAGQDCVNGESFGFDTIRLKENNLRIRFVDTSSTSSFPSRDWQITANDSSNGGANKFSIDDIDGGRTPFTIEAGAPSHSLYVDDGGRIGFGTSTPVVELHVKDGDTPTLRLEQDGSSGFTPQTWDVASNETNFFVRDATNGSTLPFRIRPSAPSSSIDIAADGDVGIGTASPDFDLDIDNGTGSAANFIVQGQSGAMILKDLDDGASAQNLVNSGIWRLRGLDNAYGETAAGMTLDLTDGYVGINCNSAADHNLVIASGGACTGTPRSWIDAGSTSFSTSSSRFFKENLTAISGIDILAKIGQVAVYSYDFIDGPRDRIGLMAEDFHQVFGRGSNKELSGHEVQLALWMAVQQLTSQNLQLTERLGELEASLLAKDQ